MAKDTEYHPRTGVPLTTKTGYRIPKPPANVAAEISRLQAEHAKATGSALNRQQAAQRLAGQSFAPGGRSKR